MHPGDDRVPLGRERRRDERLFSAPEKGHLGEGVVTNSGLLRTGVHVGPDECSEVRCTAYDEERPGSEVIR